MNCFLRPRRGRRLFTYDVPINLSSLRDMRYDRIVVECLYNEL
jgi:hypothetical protein